MAGNDEFEYDFFDPKKLSFTLEPGVGVFKIVKVEPRAGKKPPHNKMLHITLKVKDARGTEGNVDEFLVATPGDEAGMKRLATKIRNIANAINKPELYGEGVKLKPMDLIGGRGNCVIKTQSSDDYPDKSVIAKYISAVEPEELVADDDEIPF